MPFCIQVAVNDWAAAEWMGLENKDTDEARARSEMNSRERGMVRPSLGCHEEHPRQRQADDAVRLEHPYPVS
jgi:hypothetical protein